MSEKDIHARREFLQIRSMEGGLRFMKQKASCSSFLCFCWKLSCRSFVQAPASIFLCSERFLLLSLSRGSVWCQHILVSLSAYWTFAFWIGFSSWTEPPPDCRPWAVYYCAFDKYFERHKLRPSVAAFLCYFSSFLAQLWRKTRCEAGHGWSGQMDLQAQQRGCCRMTETVLSSDLLPLVHVGVGAVDTCISWALKCINLPLSDMFWRTPWRTAEGSMFQRPFPPPGEETTIKMRQAAAPTSLLLLQFRRKNMKSVVDFQLENVSKKR